MKFKTNSQLSFALLQTIEKLKSTDMLKLVFDSIDWSFIQPLVEKFYSPQGNEAYNPVSIFKCFLLPYLGEAQSMNDVANKLKFDTRLQYLCGFLDGNTPSPGTFSNHKAKWKKDTFYKIMHTLVAQLVAIGGITGKKIAIDSSHILAYSNPKKHSDPDARWGCKREDYYFFGYKIHLVVDAETQLPIEVEVTPGNEADGPKAKPLIEKTKELVSPEIAAMDSAYDSHDNYKTCVESNIIPAIDLNQRGRKPKVGEIDLFSELKIPKTGANLLRGGNTFICPATYFKLVNAGKDSSRNNRQKVLCKCKDCPFANHCKPLSDYGRVFYVYPTRELRDNILRETVEWKRLYKFRTVIERSFSELKGKHLLENPKVRGIMNIWIHVLLSLIALIVKRVKDFILKGRLVIIPETG